MLLRFALLNCNSISPPRATDGHDGDRDANDSVQCDGGPQSLRGCPGAEQQNPADPDAERVKIRRTTVDRVFVDQHRRNERQNQQRHDQPAKKVHQGRAVPRKGKFRLFPKPVALYL